MKPRASVIILSYNSGATLRQALDSVLAQRCDFPFEVLVGDDGSRDNSADIIREYAERYGEVVRPLIAVENHGVQTNYFDCFEAAQGEYIADCAGDDFWLGNDRLQRLVDALDASPSASFAYSDWTILRPDGSGELVHACKCENMLEALLSAVGRPAVHLSAALYRRDCLLKAYAAHRDDIFRNKAYGSEDLSALCALAAAGHAVRIEGTTLAYRVGHGAAITSAADAAHSARFALSTVRLVGHLAALYSLENNAGVSARMAQTYQYALSQAVISGDNALVKALLKESPQGCSLSLKTRMLMLAASSTPGIFALRTVKKLLHRRGI